MFSSMASALFLYICAFSLIGCVSSSSLSMCPHQSMSFLNNLQFQCPLSSSSTNTPLEVGGDFLDQMFNSKLEKAYMSVLFYSSSCPFSHNIHSKYKVLSSMFPQIEHLAIEQSSTMARTLARYGIHSLPSIIMVNKSSRVRFRGAKDLQSLINFYKKTTGLEPVHRVDLEEPLSLESSQKFILQSWIGSSLDEIIKREPYLVLSALFLCLSAFVFVFRKVLSRFKALWVSHWPQLNLEIFGETRQILGHLLQMVNVKSVWTKLKLYKTRNFNQGANSAHVWASLASVSLGKASCS